MSSVDSISHYLQFDKAFNFDFSLCIGTFFVFKTLYQN